MARKHQGGAARTGHTILVIDDSPDIRLSTQRMLEAEGHRVLVAPDGPSGIQVFQQEPVHLILCDYFMPGMTGEEVVRRIREKCSSVQIILATGYAGEKPARVMMRELDIQGYHDKSEGAERLLLWVDAALKMYRHVLAMEKHRKGLRFILEITPELHRAQPVDDLLQALLWQVEGLLQAEHSFLATYSAETVQAMNLVEGGESTSEGFVALVDAKQVREPLKVRVGTGRFQTATVSGDLPEPERSLVEEALRDGKVKASDGVSVVPLMLGARPIGVICIEGQRGQERDQELLEIFAQQAAAAIQNSLLFDMATTDSLTGVYVRGFAMHQLEISLKRGSRRADPVSLIMVDLDRFKQINDTYGHQTGDRALQAVADLLKAGVRETDIVGRYGGDEFMLVLPDTPAMGALTVANRLLERASRLHVEADEGHLIPIYLSVGVGTVQWPEGLQTLLGDEAATAAAEQLIASADRALYDAKGSGSAGLGNALNWTDQEASISA